MASLTLQEILSEPANDTEVLSMMLHEHIDNWLCPQDSDVGAVLPHATMHATEPGHAYHVGLTSVMRIYALT